MYIYIIQKARASQYKIGITVNPQRRLKTLQTGNEAELYLAFCVRADNASSLEKRLHRCLLPFKCKHHSEWFNLSDECLEFAREYIQKNRLHPGHEPSRLRHQKKNSTYVANSKNPKQD